MPKIFIRGGFHNLVRLGVPKHPSFRYKCLQLFHVLWAIPVIIVLCSLQHGILYPLVNFSQALDNWLDNSNIPENCNEDSDYV